MLRSLTSKYSNKRLKNLDQVMQNWNTDLSSLSSLFTHRAWLKALTVLQVLLAQPCHHLNHSLEERSSGWTMHKISTTGLTRRLPRPIPEFHTSQLFSLRHHLSMVLLELVVLHTHHHNHLWEEKNNGWIMLRISTIGKINKWLRPTQEFHTSLLFRLRLRDQLNTELLPMEVQAQHTHPHNLLWEERSNGWIMLRTSTIGEINKWQ